MQRNKRSFSASAIDKHLLNIVMISFIVCFPQRCLGKVNEILEKKIIKILADFDAIGLSVVVVKDGKIYYHQTFGYNPDYSDTIQKKTIRKENLYYLASVSKTFVGTAIMRLVEKGALSLDDDVNKYLDFCVRNPYFPEEPITIKMLLCHHSSLRKDVDYDNFDKINPKYNKQYKSFYNDYKPGSALEYSNLGFVILGAVIEKVSGLRFDHFINKYILKPLNLYGSYNVADLDSGLFVRTYSYSHKHSKFVKQDNTYYNDQKLMDQYVLGYSTPALKPAGGMVISALDLAKYMILHINKGKYKRHKRLLKEDSEKQLWQKQGNSGFGLSFVHFLTTIPGVDLIGMTGGAKGIHSAMLFQPEGKYGFVVICNGCKAKSADGSEMNKSIIRELYKSFIAN
jgi:CubicO group peptidase (beta-lactamase class C family)